MPTSTDFKSDMALLAFTLGGATAEIYKAKDLADKHGQIEMAERLDAIMNDIVASMKLIQP